MVTVIEKARQIAQKYNIEADIAEEIAEHQQQRELIEVINNLLERVEYLEKEIAKLKY